MLHREIYRLFKLVAEGMKMGDFGTYRKELEHLYKLQTDIRALQEVVAEEVQTLEAIIGPTKINT